MVTGSSQFKEDGINVDFITSYLCPELYKQRCPSLTNAITAVGGATTTYDITTNASGNV